MLPLCALTPIGMISCAVFDSVRVEGVVARRKADAGSGTGGWFRTAQGRWADCASLGTLILVAGRQAGGHMGTAPCIYS